MKVIKLPYKKAAKPVPKMEKAIIKKKKSIDIDSLDKCISCDKINCVCNEKEDKEEYSS